MTADEFNKIEEEKKLKELAEKGPGPEKPPVMKDGKFVCANLGCKKWTFTEEENNETACNYHKGAPVFHDLKKYWSCCADKVTYEFEEF